MLATLGLDFLGTTPDPFDIAVFCFDIFDIAILTLFVVSLCELFLRNRRDVGRRQVLYLISARDARVMEMLSLRPINARNYGPVDLGNVKLEKLQLLAVLQAGTVLYLQV